MPFPSRGCVTCRKRRLRCDETRPICGQCRKSSRICLGFEVDQDTLPFRSENAFASGVARRPRRSKMSENHKATSRSESISQRDQDSALKKIPRGPDIPLEVLAVNCYVQSHIFAQEHMPLNVRDWVEELISKHQTTGSDSVLASIVSAVSLATFGRTQACTEALVLGSRQYTRALAETKRVISNINEASTDRFLLTVLMLSMYEHTVCNFKQEVLLAEAFRHQGGAMALLRLRKARYSSFTPLDTVVRSMIVKQAVLRAIALPEWIQDGAQFGEEGIELGQDRYLVQLSILRSRVTQFWREKDTQDFESQQVEAQSLISQAQMIDQLISRWATDLPLDWTFTTQTEFSPGARLTANSGEGGEMLERLQYGSTISLYSNLVHAAIWNRYRASSIITRSIMMRCLPYTAPHELTRAQQLAAREEIQVLVDQICDSIPYHLDVLGSNSENPRTTKPRLDNISPSKAYILVWPLMIAAASTVIPEHQRQWIKAKIQLIARITGNGVLELAANVVTSSKMRGESHSRSKERWRASVSGTQ